HNFLVPWFDLKRSITSGLEKVGSMLPSSTSRAMKQEFLQGGRKTIASHRPVILLEVNRWHHEKRGVDFDTSIPSLLPDRYVFAELRSGCIVQINNLAQCTDTDALAIPEERLVEIDRMTMGELI